MYKSLIEEPSKSHYLNILDETITLFNGSDHNSAEQECILEQLKDIKHNVIEKRMITDWDEINERYTLGAIALQFFDEGDEIRERLSDILGGAIHYDELSD